MEAAFPIADRAGGLHRQLVAIAMRTARRTLESLHLVPHTLKGRARLKRLVMGRLRVVPAELPENFGAQAARVAVADAPVTQHKQLYVTGHKRA